MQRISRNSQRANNELYFNSLHQFKILKLVCLLMMKVQELQSQEIISRTEITFCYNSSLQGQKNDLKLYKMVFHLQYSCCWNTKSFIYNISKNFALQGISFRPVEHFSLLVIQSCAWRVRTILLTPVYNSEMEHLKYIRLPA